MGALRALCQASDSEAAEPAMVSPPCLNSSWPAPPSAPNQAAGAVPRPRLPRAVAARRGERSRSSAALGALPPAAQPGKGPPGCGGCAGAEPWSCSSLFCSRRRAISCSIMASVSCGSTTDPEVFQAFGGVKAGAGTGGGGRDGVRKNRARGADMTCGGACARVAGRGFACNGSGAASSHVSARRGCLLCRRCVTFGAC